MCGRLNLTDNPGIRFLLAYIGVPLYPNDLVNLCPGAIGSFLIQHEGRVERRDGYWSLLIQPKPNGNGFRPHPKWKTFNAQSTRLTTSPLWRQVIHQQRAIVLASAYFEWKGKQCLMITPESGVFAFAGLYQLNQFDEQHVWSFSVITAPPHSKLAHLHDNSTPVMLKKHEMLQWLDPANDDIEIFRDILTARVVENVNVAEVSSPLHFQKDAILLETIVSDEAE